MKKFETVDITTADVAFIAYGKTLPELFSNAAYALFSIMVEMENVEAKEERKVKAEGHDLESLLFDWLNELLVFYGAENLIFKEFSVSVDEKNFKLVATAKGEAFDASKHKSKVEVKAATYHKLKVWKENEMWKARVILDI